MNKVPYLTHSKNAPQYNTYIGRIYGNTEDKEGIISSVKQITFQVTDDCNLCCTYCFQQGKKHNVMDFNVAKKVIDDLFLGNLKTDYIDINKNLGYVIEFIGGEPFLEVDLIDKIIDYYFIKAIELNLYKILINTRFSLCSNGTLYFTPKVQDFIKKHQGHISLNITIDGIKENHDSCRLFPDGSGSYDLAIQALNHYHQNYQGDLNSKVTISPYNINTLDKSLISMFESGYEYIYANYVFEDVWNIEYAKILYNKLKTVADYLLENSLEEKKGSSILTIHLHEGQKNNLEGNWCGGTGKMLAIDYKGDYFPCIRYMDSSLNGEQEEYIIGNIADGIGKIKEHKIRCDELNCITRLSQSPQECLECPVSVGCAWCSGYNYQIFGTPNKRSTFTCDMHKARILANYYYQNSILKKNNINERIPFLLPKEDALRIIPEEEYNLLISLTKI